MPIQVIILNGGSSSGKSSIARALQGLLPEPWLTFGVDDFVNALPPAMQNSEDGLVFLPDGSISVGPAIRRLREAWEGGIAAIARAGVGLIIDDVFLAGATAQDRWRIALRDLRILWVGVRCDPLVAAQREARRGDRVPGMAVLQAELVHRDVAYDLAIDSTNASPETCARLIVDQIASASVT
jgi:chloramphenicol 3-O phosphotransferase